MNLKCKLTFYIKLCDDEKLRQATNVKMYFFCLNRKYKIKLKPIISSLYSGEKFCPNYQRAAQQ